MSYCFLKKYKEAEEAFEKAHALEPFDVLNIVNLATVRLWQGRPGEALDLYQKSVAQNPREPVFFLKMADLYLDEKMPSEALEMLQAVSRLNPNDPKIVREMGEDYERDGQKALAQKYFAKSKALEGTAPRQ